MISMSHKHCLSFTLFFLCAVDCECAPFYSIYYGLQLLFTIKLTDWYFNFQNNRELKILHHSYANCFHFIRKAVSFVNSILSSPIQFPSQVLIDIHRFCIEDKLKTHPTRYY